MGAQPLGYHLVNILLHATAVILVWRGATRLRAPGAWLAAVIFAVHPVEVESVAWITERKNVLSLSLALLTMLAYFRFDPPEPEQAAATPSSSRGNAWYAAALVLFALALFAKTVVVTLPAVLLVIYWWRSRHGELARRLVVAAILALSIALGLMTTWMETDHVWWGAGRRVEPIALDRLLLVGPRTLVLRGKAGVAASVGLLLPAPHDPCA